MRRRRIPWLWIIGGVLAVSWLANLGQQQPKQPLFTERYEHRLEPLENNRLRVWVLAPDTDYATVAQECRAYFTEGGVYCYVFDERRYYEPRTSGDDLNVFGESSCYRAVAIRYSDGDTIEIQGNGCE